MLTEEQKRHRNRANRARRALLKEKETFGAISDGSGKRYQVCIDFVLSDAPEKAVEFVEWFEQEFPDDVGDPAFFLYAALAYYRVGTLGKARRYLLDAMLSNIYLLPHLFAQPLPKQDMWHSSNLVEPDFIEVIEEFLDAPTSEEREWMRMQFEGELFTEIREKYIETFRALQHTREPDARGRILGDWREYLSSRREKEI
ncbi:hypothetical protein LRB11_03930 [Ectothiorhodospira haloalkaliphila]|uniref:hypothetical protein n=1 Tax=Ectothiorhodospira haloalkaliphila TaxID=421628 RepID=UPI001EE8D488|nr:hypothetical protein [Ectothiorhodospira haloalkaliphila]MCG5524080.1 hypothetical protein [Ectothiorhodospira haloalkaliphila]